MTTASLSEFAKIIGRSPGYVTKLKDEGRLVLTDDGKMVLVEESKALIIQTGGGREDVAARHADGRTTEPNEPENEQEPTSSRGRSLANVRMLHEEEKLLLTRLDRMEREGALIPKEVVDFWIDDFGATLRSLMDNLADRLTPTVLPMKSKEETHAAIVEAGEEILDQVVEKMRRRKQERLNGPV